MVKDPKITVQLIKVVEAENHNIVMEADVAGVTTTFHDFVLENAEPIRTGEYNCKVTYGVYGSVASPNMQVRELSRKGNGCTCKHRSFRLRVALPS